MKGILTWASDKIHQTVNGAYATYDWTYEKAKRTYNFLANSPYDISLHILNYFRGVTAPISPDNFTFIFDSRQAPETQHAFLISLPINASITFMGATLAGPLRNSLSYIPGMENPVVNAAVVYTVLPVASYYLTKYLTKVMISDQALNATIATTVTKEKEKDVPLDANDKFKKLYNKKPTEAYKCPHSQGAKIKGDFDYLKNYASEQFALFLLSYLPYGEYWTLPLKWISQGNLVMNAKLSATPHGMCTDCREHIVNANIPYSAGVGSAQAAANYFISNFIIDKFGITGTTFIDTYLKFIVKQGPNALLTHWFIMTSILQNKRFPETREGMNALFDIFHMPFDYLIENRDAFINQFNKLSTWFFGRQNPVPIREQIMQTADSDAAKLMSKILFTSDMQTVEDFLKLPAIKLYIEQHGPGIEANINALQNKRHIIPFARKVIPAVVKRLPDRLMSQVAKDVVKLFFSKEVGVELSKFKEDIAEINRIINGDRFEAIDIPLPDDYEEPAAPGVDKIFNDILSQHHIALPQAPTEVTPEQLLEAVTEALKPETAPAQAQIPAIVTTQAEETAPLLSTTQAEEAAPLLSTPSITPPDSPLPLPAQSASKPEPDRLAPIAIDNDSESESEAASPPTPRYAKKSSFFSPISVRVHESHSKQNALSFSGMKTRRV